MVGVAVKVGTRVFVGVNVAVGSGPIRPPQEQPRTIVAVVMRINNARDFLLIYILLFRYGAYYNHVACKMQIWPYHREDDAPKENRLPPPFVGQPPCWCAGDYVHDEIGQNDSSNQGDSRAKNLGQVERD